MPIALLRAAFVTLTMVGCGLVEEVTPTPTVPPDERLVALVREAFRGRGFQPHVVEGPIFALPPRDRLDASTLVEIDDPLDPWPPGAWLVVSAAGRWWVWEHGALTPADRLARQFAAPPRTPPRR